MANQWTILPNGPWGHHIVQTILAAIQVLISVPRFPDPTKCRTSWPCFSTKHAHKPTGQILHCPELLLRAVFCYAAHSSWTLNMVSGWTTGSKALWHKQPSWWQWHPTADRFLSLKSAGTPYLNQGQDIANCPKAARSYLTAHGLLHKLLWVLIFPLTYTWLMA